MMRAVDTPDASMMMTFVGVFYTMRSRALARLVRDIFAERGGAFVDARLVVREGDGCAVLLDDRSSDAYREFWRELVLGLSSPPRAPTRLTAHRSSAGASVDPMALGIDRSLLNHVDGLLQPDGSVVLVLTLDRGLVTLRRVLARHDEGYVFRYRLRGHRMAAILTDRERRSMRWVQEVHGPLPSVTPDAAARGFAGARGREAAFERGAEHLQESRA